MSDYLHSLAARSLNLTPAIEPRLASLFEPPPVAAGPAAAEATIETEHLEAMTSRTDELRSTAGNGSPAGEPAVPHLDLPSLPHPPLAEPRRPESPGVERRRTTSDSVPVPAAMDPVAPRSTIPSLKGGEGEFASRTPSLPTEREPLLKQAGEHKREMLAPQAGPKNSSGLEPATQRIVVEQIASHEPPRPLERAHAQSVLSEKAQASAAISMASRQAAPAIRPAARAADQTPPSPAPNTIRVTIGRVDVRAIMPQAPPPPPASPRHRPMSLEQYLKQREGDKR